MLVCPECHSKNIVWDHKNGFIVCANCGLVLDRIYVDYVNTVKKDNQNTKSLLSKVFNERKQRRDYRRRNNRIKVMTSILKEIKTRPHLTLDTKALDEYLKGKRSHVKLFKYKNWIPNDDRILKQIVEKIVDNDPILASRTERAKWAIARILLQLTINGKVDIRGIAAETKLSITHVRRLVSVTQKRKDNISMVREIININ